jgi:hypothetical protein
MKASNSFLLAVVAVAIAGGSFYGGMMFQKSRQPSSPREFFAQGQRGDLQAARRNPASGAQMASGEVVSKDDTSVTLKLQGDEGSKIILLASSTSIGKMAQGTADDLAEGTNVVVTGSSNADGSMTATMIQIRPQGDTSDFPGGFMRFGTPPEGEGETPQQ